MKSRFALLPIFLAVLVAGPTAGLGLEAKPLQLLDVFELEYASDPRISPDGRHVVYVRNAMDIRTDRRRTSLWILTVDGSSHRPLTGPGVDASSPRWSPSGDRLLYVSSAEGSSQIYVRWMDTGQTARLTHLERSPSGVTWSPDGSSIAFVMSVPEKTKPMAKLPSPPKGAKWAEPARVIEHIQYRRDGAGFLDHAYPQVFLLPADGGTPTQLTTGPHPHQAPIAFAPDGKSLLVSGNRHRDSAHDPVNTEIYEIRLPGGKIQAVTDREGPDRSPALSPDGKHLASVGFDDRRQGYQVTRLEVRNRTDDTRRVLTEKLDRSVQSPTWSSDGRFLYFGYSDRGNGKIGRVSLDGKLEVLAGDVGGTTLGRPYSSGSFSVSRDGVVAYTRTDPHHPADVAVVTPGKSPRVLTGLNEDLLQTRQLAEVEEIWFPSSFDQRSIQAWFARPPGVEDGAPVPLILEIHGGPFANYGDRFSAEVQLYAAAGYGVLYVNPRGSTSYGEEFGNLIHHNYPGEDYDDLLSAVDFLVEKKRVDPHDLFVTGGSGGGVLTSWIVGKTDQFRAAVVAKPVINWTSFALTADMYTFFHRYWFPGLPWERHEEYWRRSPLSLVGNVKTPTMLLTGEVDYRTPMSESEQYYQALKLRKIDTALVRIPGASHGIAARPSHLMSKVAHILAWFERYRKTGGPN